MSSLQGGLRYAMFMIQDPFGSTTGGFTKNDIYYPFTIVDGYPYFRKAELLLLDKARKIYLIFDDKNDTYKAIESNLEKGIPEIYTLVNICQKNLGIMPKNIEFKLNCRIDYVQKHKKPKQFQNIPVDFRGEIKSTYIGYWDHTPMDSDIPNELLDKGEWYYIPSIRQKMKLEHLEATKRKVYTTKDVRRA